MWIINLELLVRGKKTLNGQVEGKNCILLKNHLTEYRLKMGMLIHSNRQRKSPVRWVERKKMRKGGQLCILSGLPQITLRIQFKELKKLVLRLSRGPMFKTLSG